MIDAIDTSILLGALIPNAPHGDEAKRALAEAVRTSSLIISEPVYAELSAHFLSREEVDRFLADTSVRLRPSDLDVLHRAGSVWREYTRRRPATLVCAQCGNAQAVECERCGAAIRSRQHIVADFIIGAHAVVYADRLLTRDRGFYRTYFPELMLA
jgi:predicted nucleic acid-binding protein